MIASFASLMVELEKCGSSLADLHNARGFESKYLSLHIDLWQGKHSVSHVPSCSFLGKKYSFLCHFFSFIIFILFLYYFYLIFIILVFWEGSGWFRVGSQPRSQDLFPGLGSGREKALASAGHVRTLHPEILGVIN